MMTNRTFYNVALTIFTCLGPCFPFAGYPALADEDTAGRPVEVARLQVPRLDRFDHSFREVLSILKLPLPSPLMLAEASGFHQALDSNGPLSLLIVRDGESPPSFRLCIELPIRNFGQFVSPLGGQPNEPITTIRIAGEELLAGHRSNVAVLMDAADRNTLEKLLVDSAIVDEAKRSWNQWASEYDLVLLVTSDGIQQVRRRTEVSRADDRNAADAVNDELFGDAPEDNLFEFDEQSPELPSQNLPATIGRDAADRALKQLLDHLGRQLSKNQVLATLGSEIDTCGFGLRQEAAGNLVGEMRLAWRKDSLLTNMQLTAGVGPPSSFSNPPFVMGGGGELPGELLRHLAAAYVDQFIQAFDNTHYRQADVNQLRDSVLRVIDLSAGCGVLQRPTNEHVGVHTNQFLLIRCNDADDQMDAVVEAIKAWNWLMDNADGEIMQLGSNETKIRGRDAIQFDADMTAIFAPDPNSIAVPEIRAIMERLFGKDGHFRLQVVRLHDKAVLVACASVAQTEQLIAELDAEKAATTESSSRDTLPDNRCFQAVINPHEFSKWRQTAKHVEMGEVLGGPVVKIFPNSPPVTAVLEVETGRLGAHVTCPDETMRALGETIQAHR